MIFDMTDKEIEALIAQNLPIREMEKDRYGEVATPQILIDEMFDALPPAVWSDATHRWLDPAAGTGNFPLALFSRLNRTLAKRFPDPRKRRDHIVHNMLYMVELNPTSVAKLRGLFGPRANIIAGDFLVKPDVVEPTIIVGNPPFQNTKRSKYRGALGNNTLWDKFILKSLDILAPGGYLGFITPANWRKPESKLYRIMTQDLARLHYLHIFGKVATRDLFGIQSRVDLYILSKSDTSNLSKPPLIIDEKGEKHRDIDPLEWPFLPNYDYAYIRRILVDRDRGIPVLYDSSTYDARKLSKNKTRNHRFPVVHTMTKRGLGVRYAKNRTKKQFGQAKVLLNANERLYPYNDYRGKYGMSQLTFGLPIKSQLEGDAIVDRINTPRFQEMIKATKWGAFQTDHHLFEYITPNYRKWG